jgi:hypothetical protein
MNRKSHLMTYARKCLKHLLVRKIGFSFDLFRSQACRRR